ncbi:MAG: amidohydrolase family protein [Candidatus Kapaibacterium sp.]
MVDLGNGEKSLKVDVHTHIMPPNMPDYNSKFGYGEFIHLEHHKPCCAKMMAGPKFFREIEDNCWDGDARINDCDHHSVDVQVISPIPVLFYYWAKAEHAEETSKYQNDFIKGLCDKHPTRFIGLGTVPLQDPKRAIKELERCVNDLGLPGVEIGTHINDWNLSAEELFDFFAAAEELNASIFVHPWDMMGKSRMEKYWLPWLVGMPAETSLAICSVIFGGVLERLPKLKMLFAHAGGSFPSTISRIEHGFNVRPDLCAIDNNINPRDYLGKFYIDSLTHDEQMLKYVVDLMGEDMVALGTDYPFPLGELEPGRLIESVSDYSPELKRKLLSTNAFDWLGIDGSGFLNH